MRRLISALLLLTLALPAAAQQAPTRRQIEAPAGAVWVHQRSGVALPARIGDFARAAIVENTPGEVDVLAQYEDAATRVTVILFRPQQNDVGFWFDRAELALNANPMLVGLTPTTPDPLRFASSISPTMSALRRSYGSTGRWKGTGTVLIPVGRWLVKVRASSSSLDAAEIDRLLDAAIAAIRLPADAAASPEARVVQPCADRVAWQQATAIATSTAEALESSVGVTMTSLAAADASGHPPVGLAAPGLCRDATRLEFGNVYRVPDDADRYWIGFSDSGDVAVVGRRGPLPDQLRVELSIATPVATQIYPRYESLPAPSQALAVLTSSGPVARVSFNPEAPAGEGPRISIITS